MRHTRALPVLVIVLAGCGTDAAPRAEAVVDTVDGVERLTYPSEHVGDLGWALDTVGVLGDAFASDAYQFNDVLPGGLGADGEGNLYVLDRQGGRVLKYGPDGQHLATLGRQGEGPGELSQPISLAVGPGDTVWVTDFSNGRITGFSQDGGDPRTVPFPEGSGIPDQRLAVLDDGFLTMFRPLFNFRRSGGSWSMSRGGDESEDQGPPRLPVLRLTPSLEPVDTLWTTREPPMDMVQLESADRLMVTMMAREFYPEFQWSAFGDGGLVVSDSAAYVLHLLDADGNRVRTLTRGPAPRPTTEADRKFARQRVREENESSIRIGGAGPDDETQQRLLEQRLEKMTFDDLIPRVVSLTVDPADRIWVGVSEATPGEVERIDIYDRSGALLGELRDFPVPDVFTKWPPGPEPR